MGKPGNWAGGKYRGPVLKSANTIFFSRNKQPFLWKETIKGGVYDETERKTVGDADMAT